MKLSEIPRYKLANLPTPLEYCGNLSAEFKNCEIWIKRDDLTGHSFGGNKERKLEFILADAIARQADTLVTVGSLQSNHCRITAALANKLKLKTVLILIAEHKNACSLEGSYLVDKILGAEVHIVKSRNVRNKIKNVLAELKKSGANPYFIEGGGHNELGAAGYINALEEIKEQSERMGIAPDYIFFPTGTGTTHAGLAVGRALFHFPAEIAAVSIARDQNRCLMETADIIHRAFTMLEIDYEPPPMIIYDKYIGNGYGELYSEALKNIKFLAETEGMMLDPVYNAKAFTGMLDRIKRKKLQGCFVYINTGGSPGIFTDYFRKKTEKSLKP